jgi:hypothetical protein
MTGPQGLFDNDYRALLRVEQQMRRKRRLRIAGALAGAIVVLFAISFLTAPALAFAPPASGTSSSFDTGSVHVLLPSPQPNIQLSQDANLSVSASLTLARIVELHASSTQGSAGPSIVAAAFPTDVQSYNLTDTTTGALSWTLKAGLVVDRTSGLLFPPHNFSQPFAPLVPYSSTNLTVVVSSNGAADRVAVTSTITGWPFVNPTDLLALQWQFGVGGATGYAACLSPTAPVLSSSPCGANPFASAPASWAVGYHGFEGLGPKGPVSLLTWNQSATTASGASTVTVGAASASSTQAELVLGAAPQGSSDLTFGLSYALAVPLLPVPLLVHGSLGPFVGGAVAAASAGLVGVYLVRRRGQKLLDEL